MANIKCCDICLSRDQKLVKISGGWRFKSTNRWESITIEVCKEHDKEIRKNRDMTAHEMGEWAQKGFPKSGPKRDEKYRKARAEKPLAFL
jgi:hypothetical protein